VSLRVGILGASGYGGGELLRILSAHPQVGEIAAMSRRNAGKPVATVHPNLRGIVDQPFVEKVAWSWLAEAETPVLFSAIPHGELAVRYEGFSEEWERVGLAERLTVVDLSADFRIRSPQLYEEHYKAPHPCADRLAEWTYGFPERNAGQLAGAKRIANPGCFASALQLGLLPILRLQGIEFVAASGATGSSGSGMEPSATTHHPMRSNDFRAYKMLAHQHMAEARQLLHEADRPDLELSFVPHSAPIVRGILATLQFLGRSAWKTNELEAACREAFAGAAFVRLVEGSPRVAAVAGSNFADVGWASNGRQGAILVALDNLGKGMAGQAVQNMNLALGFDESDGLRFAGGFPY
jgi:LysW-gamma-L-alpha-aminoadipyl-6-phosphate/LysW-L-glutamyl-5-phosphate reductase